MEEAAHGALGTAAGTEQGDGTLSLLAAVLVYRLCAETGGNRIQTRAFLETAIDINMHIHTVKLDQQMGILLVGTAIAFHKAKMKLQGQEGRVTPHYRQGSQRNSFAASVGEVL